MPIRTPWSRARVGPAVLAALLGGAVACGNGTQDREAWHLRLERLEARVERVESLRAVKRLQRAYGHYAEVGLWHDLADLFADDAVGHYPAGVLTGKAPIHALFFDEVGEGRLGLADGRIYPHIVLQPIVTLAPDGLTARGRWHVFALLGGYGRSATWVGGIYENEYVKDEGVWKIRTLQYDTQFTGAFGSAEWSGPEWTFQTDLGVGEIGRPSSLPDGVPESETVSAPDRGSLVSRLGAIEARVGRLQDEADVRNLQHSYGYYVDRKLWDDVADLFSDSATMELGQRGVYVGPARIRESLARQLGAGGGREGDAFAVHHVTQPVIHASPDGASARIRMRLLEVRGQPGAPGAWLAGVFEDEAVREDGVWKLQSVDPDFTWTAAHGAAWAEIAGSGEVARPAENAGSPPLAETFPPDRPLRGPAGVPFPAIESVAFDYPNPVTGREPARRVP